MDDLFPNLYAYKKPESNLGFMDVLGKAFKLENDVVNLYDYVTRPAFESDPNFDYERSWQEQKLPLEWKPILAQSVSEADFQARLGRIREEEQNKAILAAAGWGGTFAAMAAGMLSPTALIPVAGAGARGTNAVAQSFALAGLGARASEAALLLNQETRTGAEAAASIGINTVLAGLWGLDSSRLRASCARRWCGSSRSRTSSLPSRPGMKQGRLCGMWCPIRSLE